MKFLENASVYYINLEERKDRDIYVSNHFSFLRIEDYERIAACVPEDVNQETLLVGENLGSSKEEVACTASHLKAVKHFLETSSNDYAIICEDDVDLSNMMKIDFTLKDLLASQDTSVECIQLTVSAREDYSTDFTAHARSVWDFCCAAYALTRTGAQKIIDKYYKDGVFVLDNFVSTPYTDYRNGAENRTELVAENVVYGALNTVTCPLATYQTFSSSLQSTEEQERQAVKSRNDFYVYWDSYDSISVEDIKGLVV